MRGGRDEKNMKVYRSFRIILQFCFEKKIFFKKMRSLRAIDRMKTMPEVGCEHWNDSNRITNALH